MGHLLATFWLRDLGDGLGESVAMFWQSLWALVFGFLLSGLVRAGISTDAMERRLGRRGVGELARASGYGMASSSCSYAASAMAKSLFQKGADLVNAMGFMIASTNLVVELGIVMLALLGWQFALGELVGGPIMVALFAAAGSVMLPRPLVERARERLRGPGDAASVTEPDGAGRRRDEPPSLALLRASTWADAAGYAVADARMLRRELVIGYVLAGFLARDVPLGWWKALFLPGHGALTSVENAIVGPIVAGLSCVCSIGNVPLAAALWKSGITFAGVLAFILGDLVTIPLLLIYRRYYGTALTVRLVALLYAVMVAAGLAVEGIFSFAGIAPHAVSHHLITAAGISWDSTSYLDLVALAVGIASVLARRYRSGGAGGGELATDPVCGMQVRAATAPASLSYGGTTVYFCSDRCKARCAENRERFLQSSRSSVSSFESDRR